ncbi:MAG: DsbA family protein [Wolbachia endosymbiont of Fragariocoptes setiger]|nr:DsbA family protein [Wolbachia endosymbiont of Fragariocoptes setiger]
MITRLLLLLTFLSVGLHCTTTEITQKELLSLLPDDKFLGNEKAPIIMIEYASLTCYHCSLFHKEVLPQIKKKYIDTGKVLYVFRHFPMDYRALKSSMLSYCYTKQEDYFNFNKAVFNSIDSWNYSNASDLSLLNKIAALSNLKQDKLNQCIDSQEIMDKIINSKLLAINKLGVTGSPAFFIKLNNDEFNGDYKHEGYRKLDYFVSVIEKLHK